MRLVVRSLLIWLMALAMPLQGMAAATRLHCGPTHSHLHGAAVAQPMADAGHAPGAPAHEHHHAPPASPLAAGADHGAPADTASLDGGTCSACAACCSAVVLPAGSVAMPAAPAASFVMKHPTQEPVSFVPGGLERPPRARRT